MLRIASSGSFSKTTGFLNRLKQGDIYKDLNRYGRMGADALSKATPRDTGLTANSWTYDITRTATKTIISWNNTNANNGTKVAILLQYGHGTGTGGYVAGTDYINPALRPIFDQIAEDVWKKVTSG